MHRWTVAAIAVSGLLGAPAAAASEATIAVEGNHRLGAGRIKAFFPPGPGGGLSDADLDAALKAMYRGGEFAKVTIRRDGAVIHVGVDENPVIARIVFEGNKKLGDSRLQPFVQSHNA